MAVADERRCVSEELMSAYGPVELKIYVVVVVTQDSAQVKLTTITPLGRLSNFSATEWQMKTASWPKDYIGKDVHQSKKGFASVVSHEPGLRIHE